MISTHPDEPMRTYSAIGGPWKLEVSLDENDLVLGRELFRLDREGESQKTSARSFQRSWQSCRGLWKSDGRRR